MELKPGYKQTELGVIPEDWDIIKLRSVVRGHNSGIYKKRDIYGSGCNIIGVSDLYGIDKVDGQLFSQVPLLQHERAKHTLESDDLLYGESSLVREGIARTVYVTAKGAGTAFAWHTRRYSVDQSCLLSPYLYYYLQSLPARKHMMDHSIQTAITGINTVAYFECPIIKPTVHEQHAIAAALTDVDDLITSLDKLIAKKRDIKQAAMQQLLTGKRRLPGFEQKAGFKPTEVGMIPEDWEVFRLSACAKRITDGEHVTPARTATGYYLLSARNILNGRLSLTNVDYVGESEYQRIRRRCNPEAGDLLMSCSGTVGRVATVPKGFECVMVRSAALVKPDPAILSGLFVQYFLQSTAGQKQIFASLNQGAQANLFLNHIQGLRIPLPHTTAEQDAIATVLSDMDAQIAALEARRDKTKLLKQGMMQELLTGRIRLS